jgi:hypothetical protein
MTSSDSYGYREATRSRRARKLFAPTESASRASAQELLKIANDPRVITDLILRAGQEALRCSGSGWIPHSDLRVVAQGPRAFLLRLGGFRLIEASVNPQMFLQRCVLLLTQGVGPNPLAILENTAGALVRLFAGYYEICPYDSWRHSNLVHNALLGAYGSTWVSPREEELAIMVTLFFEQSVVSHALTEIEGRLYVEGITGERVVNQHPYLLLVGLFERCQATLYPKAWGGLPSPLAIQPSPLADALLPEVIHLLFGVHLRSIRGRLLLRGRPRRPDSWEWPTRVRYLAELLVPYLERQRDEQGQQPAQNPFSLPNTGGGQPAESPLPGSTSFSFDPGAASHPFAGQDLQFNPNQLGYGTLPGMGPSGPPRFANYEYIDRYYTERANTLVVRDASEDEPNVEPERIAVGFLDHEPASVLDLVGGQIDWFRTRIDSRGSELPGGLRLFRRTEPLEIPLGGDEPEAVAVPHLMLVVDSSGSMKFNPAAQEGARGQYDVVLMACWGMFAFIQSQSTASNVQANALNFSNDTSASGWHACSNLEPVKRVLACYKGGNTTLDTGKLRAAYRERPGQILLVVMTDGGLSNTSEAVSIFGDIVADGNHVVLLHIGAPNAFTTGIEKLGCPTHLLNDASQLIGLCLDLAKERYQVTASR